MLYTKTVIIRGQKFKKTYSTKQNQYNCSFKLPEDLDEQLDKEINHIYSSDVEIINITINPIIAFFDVFPIPIMYTIVYTYKTKENGE